MIEPNYDSLTIPQLQRLCFERRIKYDVSTPRDKLTEMLVDHDYERALSQLNPE